MVSQGSLDPQAPNLGHVGQASLVARWEMMHLWLCQVPAPQLQSPAQAVPRPEAIAS